MVVNRVLVCSPARLLLFTQNTDLNAECRIMGIENNGHCMQSEIVNREIALLIPLGSHGIARCRDARSRKAEIFRLAVYFEVGEV